MKKISSTRTIFLVAGVLLSLWSVKAAIIYTSTPLVTVEESRSFNSTTRRFMAQVDAVTKIDGRAKTLSWPLFVFLPGLLSLCFFSLLLPQRRKCGRISGEVIWGRALYDPDQKGKNSINDFVRVRVGERVAKLGTAYLRADGFWALPFVLEDMPFEIPLIPECEVATDFPRDLSLGQVVTVKRVQGSNIMLKSNSPTVEAVTFKLGVFEPK